MIKKRFFREFLLAAVLFGIFAMLAIMLVSAVSEEVDSDPQLKVDKAYSCLEQKVKEKGCSKLSLRERIFSLLSIYECKKEITTDSSNNMQCWPKSKCNVKDTAQAILALNNANTDTSKAQEWLLAQNMTASEVEWLLQIETKESSSCEISYSGSKYRVNIDDEKKINSNAGNCLTLYAGGYWLRVSPSCYDKEFEISCDKDFVTSFLFKKKSSATLHVSEEVNSASAEGTTIEKVKSLCFRNPGSTTCDYEGTLWASLVLKSLDNDVSYFMPYLVAMKDENEKYLPEVFLYFLTGYDDIRNELLSKQKGRKYWDESGDKFYDTALALYAFQYEEPEEKTNAINWLLDPKVQGKNGCWDSGDIVNTAFILFSVWPKPAPIVEEGVDCEGAGYYCMTSLNCQDSGGEILEGYTCSSFFECCSKERVIKTCESMGGEICNSNQQCIGGRTETASDLIEGESCCVGGGYCTDIEREEKSECEAYGGTCSQYGCSENEEGVAYSCKYGDTCCIPKSTGYEEKSSYWWIWLLVFLILLALLGIVFRDKIRPYWFRLNSKFKGGRGAPGFPRFPRRGPPFGPSEIGTKIRRRVLPVQPRRVIPTRMPQKAPKVPANQQIVKKEQPQQQKPKDLDEVLKKLKELGK